VGWPWPRSCGRGDVCEGGAGYASSQYRPLGDGLRLADPAQARQPLSGVGLVAALGGRLPLLGSGHRALDGRLVCHRSSSYVGSSGPSDTRSEWVRWLNSGCCQGDAQESLHPNAYGQRAMGRCIQLAYAQTSGNWLCRNTAGQGVGSMYLTSSRSPALGTEAGDGREDRGRRLHARLRTRLLGVTQPRCWRGAPSGMAR
jgi:hypothetical protein